VFNPIKVAVLGFWHVHAAEYATRARCLILAACEGAGSRSTAAVARIQDL
jgi:hypothetical protein